MKINRNSSDYYRFTTYIINTFLTAAHIHGFLRPAWAHSFQIASTNHCTKIVSVKSQFHKGRMTGNIYIRLESL